MTFDEEFPGEEWVELEHSEIMRTEESATCEVCGSETNWSDVLSFSAICSRECYDRMWNGLTK